MNLVLDASSLLAQIGTADSANTFFSEGLGAMIQKVFIAVGILIVVLTLGRAVKSFVAAKFPDVAKTLVGGILAAVLCFDLTLPFSLISGVTGLVKAMFTTIGGFFGG